nr:hypothetical protein [Tanacetum cinerariifolium]
MGKAVNDDLVVTENNGTESEVLDDNSRSGNDTDAHDADIRPIYDEEPKAKVQLTTECNIFAIRQQHTEQPEIINEALKSGQHGQVLNDESNKAKIKKEIDVLEIINIELEHKVANFRKENETLKMHYKDLKLKGNSVDTKFAKTSVLGKPVLQPLRNQSVVRQPNAFKHERPPMSKQRFASQVDVNHNLSKPATQHYLPKKSESAFAKPNNLIASSSSRNSSKNMPRFSSNDMVHNHYLDEAKKKTQERDRNSKPSVMTPARFQSTPADSKQKPRSTNHSFRSLPIDRNKPVDQKSHTQIPGRQIFIGHKFSPNKTSAVYKKISPRSDLRWQLTGRIFKSVGLRWLPTGKLFNSCTNKVKSEPPHGSNVDISKIHVYKQTLDLSPGTSINVPKEQSLDVSAGKVSQADRTVITSNELDLLFSPMLDELLNGSSKVVSKSSTVSAADAPNQRQQLTTPLNNHTTPAPTCQIPTLAPTVI